MKDFEVQKINQLYGELDKLAAENKKLTLEALAKGDRGISGDAIMSRLDDLEGLIKDLACKCGHESTKKVKA